MARAKHKSAQRAAAARSPESEGVEARSSTARALDTAAWIVIVAGVLLIPLWVSPSGEESFRYPKELLFRGEAILLTAILALYLILVPREFPLGGVPRSLWILVGAIVGWTVVTTLTSTNVELSVQTFLWVLGAAVVFLCTYVQLRTHGERAIWLAIIPALINALIAIAQATDIWRPLETTSPAGRLQVIGLMGNPNDVGALLVVPGLAAAALSVSARRSLGSILSAIVIPIGILASVTLTAIIALLAGLAVLVFNVRRRVALVVLLLVTLALTAIVSFEGPARRRILMAFDQLEHGGYNSVVSNRLGSSLVALEIITDHPIVGSGPGTYGWNYFDHSFRVADKYGDLLTTADPMHWAANFGEAHNDHLEIASEMGIPSYALFVITLLWLLAFRSRSEDEVFLSRLTPAVTAGFFVTCIGLFPLQLAGASHSILFFAAIIASQTTRIEPL
jgi:O-antigen ligase